ncbi:MAG: acyl-CoA synthetase, partial [Solirubrobacterales bacterium]|nr:acyl-CoA synthetase [Solirubrobacterales bacterium]
MTNKISEALFVARTFRSAGIIRPARPDRALRAVVGLRRWGPTLAAGYLGAAARYPDAPAVIDELGELSFAEVHARTNSLARGLAANGIA